MWGKSRNVTDNSPTRLGTLRAALSYPKYDGVSWVWSTIVVLVKVKCYVTRPYSAIFYDSVGYVVTLHISPFADCPYLPIAKRAFFGTEGFCLPLKMRA